MNENTKDLDVDGKPLLNYLEETEQEAMNSVPLAQDKR
jgi:hypothetical protein